MIPLCLCCILAIYGYLLFGTLGAVLLGISPIAAIAVMVLTVWIGSKLY